MRFSGTRDGFAIAGLRNRNLELCVVPELGGRIVSLTNRQDQTQWCWQSAAPRPWRRLTRGTPFDQGALAGFDECIPTVAACTSGHTSHVDHGDAWTSAWQVTSDNGDSRHLRMQVELESVTSTLERTIHLLPEGLRFDYLLSNHSPQPQQILWAFHPLFPLQANTRLLFWQRGWEWRIESIEAPDGDTAHAPEAGPGLIDWLLERPTGAPACAKLFARTPPGLNRITIDRNGSKLHVSVEQQHIPWIGVWVSAGGWHGHHHLAIEPSNAGCDAVSAANDLPLLAPGGKRAWAFEMHLEPSHEVL